MAGQLEQKGKRLAGPHGPRAIKVGQTKNCKNIDNWAFNGAERYLRGWAAPHTEANSAERQMIGLPSRDARVISWPARGRAPK